MDSWSNRAENGRRAGHPFYGLYWEQGRGCSFASMPWVQDEPIRVLWLECLLAVYCHLCPTSRVHLTFCKSDTLAPEQEGRGLSSRGTILIKTTFFFNRVGEILLLPMPPIGKSKKKKTMDRHFLEKAWPLIHFNRGLGVRFRAYIEVQGREVTTPFSDLKSKSGQLINA